MRTILSVILGSIRCVLATVSVPKLAVFLLLIAIAAPAYAQCINCTPGTEPANGYRATYSTGAVVVMTRSRDNPCQWGVTNRGIAYRFFHTGLGLRPPGSGGGLFAAPTVFFQQEGGFGDPDYGMMAVAQPRDGSGSWVLTIRNSKGVATGVTVTISPVP